MMRSEKDIETRWNIAVSNIFVIFHLVTLTIFFWIASVFCVEIRIEAWREHYGVHVHVSVILNSCIEKLRADPCGFFFRSVLKSYSDKIV